MYIGFFRSGDVIKVTRRGKKCDPRPAAGEGMLMRAALFDTQASLGTDKLGAELLTLQIPFR